MPHEEVRVTEDKPCNFCADRGVDRRATVDGKTLFGPWANMCDDDFEFYGVGLGLGRGQRLIYPDMQS